MAKPLKLAVAGLGTVGTAFVRHIAEVDVGGAPAPEVIAVCARDKSRDRGINVDGFSWFDDPVAMAETAGADVFVELIGGDEGPALLAVEAALKTGSHVVTANKALLAAHGVKLARLAEENGASLNFEAAVAGCIPIIKTLRESLQGNNVDRVVGIMNGTCNYILTRMERENLSFEDCLADAQRLGYAEADPEFDIDGHDTAHKLAILSSLAFGTEIAADATYVEGIRSITSEDIRVADEMGYRIKLLGVAQRTDSGIEQRVHPTMVPKSAPIAGIDGVTNAVEVEASLVGTMMLVGAGAGGDATASAVMADVLDLARGQSIAPLGLPTSALKPHQRARMRAHEGGYCLRLLVHDRQGAFAAIASRMAEQDISLESIVQRQAQTPDADSGMASAVLITHETTEQQIRQALENIATDGHIAGPAQMIRIN